MDWENEKERLGKEIIFSFYNEGMIKTWYRDKPEGWFLVSGLWSPMYIQLRGLLSYPKLLAKIGNALSQMIEFEIKNATKLVGIAMAGIPIAVATSLSADIPCAMTRKLDNIKTINDFENNLKTYGEHSLLEGELASHDRVVLIDDLVTRFDSKLVALKQVEYEIKKRTLNDVICSDVVVVFDREQGAKQEALKYKVQLHSLISFKSTGIKWLAELMSKKEVDVLTDYLDDSEKYQNPEIQVQLMNDALRQ